MSARRAGKANAEFLLYMTLLLVLGLLVFSLAAAGSGAYAKLIDRKERDGELRVAVSYLVVVLRKHDAAGAVRLGDNPFGEGPALFLMDESAGDVYETVVFCQDGTLRELMYLEGSSQTYDMTSAVAHVQQVDFSTVGSGVRIHALAADGTSLSSYVFLRSFQGATP
jgi:hypothetical protein